MKLSRLITPAALAFAAAMPLLAAEPQTIYRDYCAPVDEAVVALPPSEAGIWIFTDDDTGALRRRIAEQQAKTGSLNWSSAGLTIMVAPDGTKNVDLEGRFMTDFVVRVENGRIVEGCVDRPDAPPPAPKWEEK